MGTVMRGRRGVSYVCYLMKNLKKSANLLKWHNGCLETVQPYWIAYKKNGRNRIYNKSTYALYKMLILKFLTL